MVLLRGSRIAASSSSKNLFRMLANTLRVERTERLEGTQTSPRRLKLPTSPCRLGAGRLRRAGRFTRWQLCGLVSRRLPGTSRGVAVLWAGCTRLHGIGSMGKTSRWVTPESRPLLTDRAAISPQAGGLTAQPGFLRRRRNPGKSVVRW
jgi:hypothetical protein